MLDNIVKSLKKLNISTWEIQEENTKAWEFYFIKHQLDQHRLKDVSHTKVTVYSHNEDGSLGNASSEIPPFSTVEEIEKELEQLHERASYIHNQSYELVGKTSQPGHQESVDLAQISKDFINVVHSIQEDEESYINSYEIFVQEKTVRQLNSEGLDVTNTYPSSMLEIILNAREGDHEIELYRNYRSGRCDATFLASSIQQTLAYGKDRLKAVPTPVSQKMPVLFAGKDSVTLFDYYLFKLNAQAKLMEASHFEKGKEIHDSVVGDKVSLYSHIYLENSSINKSVDNDGSEIKEECLLDQNVVKKFIGNRRFSSYAGLEASYEVANYEISGGTYTEEGLRTGDYLEVVDFSDFQMDGLKGDFAGEIRLAYLHQGGKVTIVTGGSISDNWENQIEQLKMSRTQRQYNRAVVPSVVLLPNVMVTGVNHE